MIYMIQQIYWSDNYSKHCNVNMHTISFNSVSVLHRKLRVSHLTHLSQSESPHGQNDSLLIHFWVTLSVRWLIWAQMSQSNRSFLCTNVELEDIVFYACHTVSVLTSPAIKERKDGKKYKGNCDNIRSCIRGLRY